MKISLGTYARGSAEETDTPVLRIVCDAPELLAHADSAWLRAYAAERLGLPPSGAPSPSGKAEVTDAMLARHTCLCGASGSGKTRLAVHLLSEQLKAGCSAVVLDPKAQTIQHLLVVARQAGLPPEQVTLLAPGSAGVGAPGWNPLDIAALGIGPAQAAADFVSVLEKSTSSWGPRLQDLLTNALILIAAHGLSLFELVRFLQREDYREGLLRQPAGVGGQLSLGDRVAVGEAQEFFTQEFAGWGRGERAQAVAPVLNKVRELLRSPFLRALLCARRTSLDLSSLWQRQRLLLVHLDRTSLGDEGVRLLGGLLVHQLYRTALRVEGPVPVVLSLDELGISEQFVGSAVREILAIARSQNLRLLVACQHLAQLSEDLRTALLANTAVQGFFKLGPADAKAVAAALAAGTGEAVSCIAADVAKRDARTGLCLEAETAHLLCDGWGNMLRLSEAAWKEFHSPSGNAATARRDALSNRAKVLRYLASAPIEDTPENTSKLLPTYLDRVLDALVEAVGTSRAAIVLFEPQANGRLAVKRMRQIGFPAPVRLLFAELNAFARSLAARGAVTIPDALQEGADKTAAEDREQQKVRHTALRKLSALGIGVAVPLSLGQELAELLLVAERPSGEHYSRSDCDFLEAIAGQATLALQQRRFAQPAPAPAEPIASR